MGFYDTYDLPASIKQYLELSPVEDLLLIALREYMPGVVIRTLIPDLDRVPFIQLRRNPGNGYWHGDPRFVDHAKIQVNTFTKDPDGDTKGALWSEAVRVAFRKIGEDCYTHPQLGSITRIKMENEPARKSDWATATGPVQYADLPTGIWRYETTYSVRIRKSKNTVPTTEENA